MPALYELYFLRHTSIIMENLPVKSSNKLMRTLLWIFGIIFFIAGVVGLTQDPIAGAAMLVMGVILIPPFWSFFRSKAPRVFTTQVRIIMAIILFVIVGITGAE